MGGSISAQQDTHKEKRKINGEEKYEETIPNVQKLYKMSLKKKEYKSLQKIRYEKSPI